MAENNMSELEHLNAQIDAVFSKYERKRRLWNSAAANFSHFIMLSVFGLLIISVMVPSDAAGYSVLGFGLGTLGVLFIAWVVFFRKYVD